MWVRLVRTSQLLCSLHEGFVLARILSLSFWMEWRTYSCYPYIIQWRLSMDIYMYIRYVCLSKYLHVEWRLKRRRAEPALFFSQVFLHWLPAKDFHRTIYLHVCLSMYSLLCHRIIVFKVQMSMFARLFLVSFSSIAPGYYSLLSCRFSFSQGRTHIFKIHAKTLSVDRNIRYELLARLCPNSTGADIRSVCTEAGILAIRSRKKVKN